MDREWDPEFDLLQSSARRHLFERDTGRSRERARPTSQAIPINIYDTGEDIVIVAPMPGVQADNIDVEVLGTRVTLRAEMRGPHQEDRRYLVHEWTYGPYERHIELPFEVDAEHANASHDNGVLALTLPKAARDRAVRVPLKQAASSQSLHQGHSGHHTSRDGLAEE